MGRNRQETPLTIRRVCKVFFFEVRPTPRAPRVQPPPSTQSCNHASYHDRMSPLVAKHDVQCPPFPSSALFNSHLCAIKGSEVTRSCHQRSLRNPPESDIRRNPRTNGNARCNVFFVVAVDGLCTQRRAWECPPPGGGIHGAFLTLWRLSCRGRFESVDRSCRSFCR